MNSLLKFITCGSVDDGKSTLIGHMLYDAKLIFADQERALELDSRVGSAGGDIDYSLLLDGLMAEREQGITIDVAYRYFTTEKRSFIVADTPGHEEYTRNMAVGASFADLAVILVDASQGVLVQTKRHSRICSLMGIRDFVIAVNKMDLTDYSEDVFASIKGELEKFFGEIDCRSLQVIPVSATKGDNITEGSTNMDWYEGPSLLSYLEDVDVSRDLDEEKQPFILPVQRVSRPDRTYRGFQGQIESGVLHTGDEVTALPSGQKACVEGIISAGKHTDEAVKGEPVSVLLDREIDISRGNVICSGQMVRTGNGFTADILWMDEQRLIPGRNYILKVGTSQITAAVVKIRHRVDINSGEHVDAETLSKNEIGSCEISCTDRIPYTVFRDNQAMGSLILIDVVSHMTSACGVIRGVPSEGENLTWHNMDVTRRTRAMSLGQMPKTLWFTGLSGSGKSTLANEIEKRMAAAGKHTMLLDGDNVRMGLNRNLGFSEEDRVENIRRIAEVSRLMNDAGLIVLTSFISPFEADRQRAREIIGSDFIEIYVSTPLEECEKRDVKGLYKKARAGEIPQFTGISSPYEIPSSPEITVDTSGMTLKEAADYVISMLEKL